LRDEEAHAHCFEAVGGEREEAVVGVEFGFEAFELVIYIGQLVGDMVGDSIAGHIR
jgi:hypothetical protein